MREDGLVSIIRSDTNMRYSASKPAGGKVLLQVFDAMKKNMNKNTGKSMENSKIMVENLENGGPGFVLFEIMEQA